jgi:hypothetical protein
MFVSSCAGGKGSWMASSERGGHDFILSSCSGFGSSTVKYP